MVEVQTIVSVVIHEAKCGSTAGARRWEASAPDALAIEQGCHLDRGAVALRRLQRGGRWALSERGLVDRITQPVLMINGRPDHLAPIGNICFMLENGPPIGRQARVYADAGHCAFKYFAQWAPASFGWLAGHLT